MHHVSRREVSVIEITCLHESLSGSGFVSTASCFHLGLSTSNKSVVRTGMMRMFQPSFVDVDNQNVIQMHYILEKNAPKKKRFWHVLMR